MNCKEQIYELIGQIYAYPDSGIKFTQPFNLAQKFVTASDYTPTESTRIVIPMKKKSATLKETPSVSVSGESYEVVISWQIEHVSSETYQTLDLLKAENKHLIVNTFGDSKMLIRSTEYAYQFQYKESDGMIACELTVQNICGAQRIL